MTQTPFHSFNDRNLFYGLALSLVAGASFLPMKAQQASFKGKGKVKSYQITALQRTDASHRVEFKLDNYALDVVEEGGTRYSKINCQGGVMSNKKGFAELPFFHATLQLPVAQNCHLVIEAENHKDIVLDYPMLPSKGTIYRNQNPASIQRAIASESLQGGWFPAEAAKIAEPFVFRDVQGINVYLYPFQYDGTTQTLRVYTQMVVRVEPDGEVLTREFAAPRNSVAEMEHVYSSMFLKCPTTNVERWSHEVSEVGDMLVIYTARDTAAIQPYVQWKREKGYKVKVIEVATGTKVKETIQNEYAANPSLLYVQLVGDWADIKSDIGTQENKPMDPALGCVAGNDAYPELIIGRFSANTADQVTTQVNKAINYEKNPDVSGTWYKKGLVIGSSEGPGDDNESDTEHEIAIRDERLLRTTFSDVSGALGDSSTKSMISGPVNAGLSVINYTGHGAITYWGTTGFGNNDVSLLNNGNKLPVICSVACVNGSFQSDCFAEAWLRNPNGGAAAGMFSTINQPWEPPMRGQDYFNDLLTGGYDYVTRPGDGTSTTYGRSTFGSLAVNAVVLMYSESNTIDDLDTIKTWTTFGDASLQVRTDTPITITLSSIAVDTGLAFSTRVTSGGVGVSNALVSLSQGDQVFSGLTDANGNIALKHGLSVGTAKLVVTGQNTTTIYRDITVGQSVAVMVAIDPTTATLTAGSTKQFAATVTGSTNTEVTWTCTGGTVSKSGLYTAPSAAGTYTVTVTSNADNTKSASATVTVTPLPQVSVSINPTAVKLIAGNTQQFIATVTGTTNTDVTWSCTGGKVSKSGLYTAPSAAGTYTVTVTSNADNTKSASATVTVTPLPQVSISINPTTATLTAGSTKQFAATVTGSTNTEVTWTCTGGIVSKSGLYTAPSAAGTYTVTVTSNADNTKSASATVTVTPLPQVSISINPITATLIAGSTKQFAATVTGSTNTEVTWTCTGGTVSKSGLYIAPSAAGTYTVKVTSNADSTKSASATVTVTPLPQVSVSINPTAVKLIAGNTQQFIATVTGTTNTNVTWSCTGGKVSKIGLYTAPRAAGTYTVTVTSKADNTKLASAFVTVTNNGESTYNEEEDNDYIFYANVVPDSAKKIVGNISNKHDRDYFKVYVEAGKTLTVDLIDSSEKCEISLYNKYGTPRKNHHTYNNRVTFKNFGISSTYYYISVKRHHGVHDKKDHHHGDHTGSIPYQLIVSR